MRTRNETVGIYAARFALASLALAANPAHGNGIDWRNYQNKNRLVFVFAPDKANRRYQNQAALWRGKRAGLNERDIVRFDVFNRGGAASDGAALTARDAAALRKRFVIQSGAFRVLLIGKDGHTAFSSGQPVRADRLFGLIDVMPMRRLEMKERKQKGE